MRVLVVGAGRMGALRAQDLAADPRVSQVLIANRSPDRAEEVAARVGAGVADWERVADLAGAVDGIVVTPATAAHAEILGQVLPAGRPVLCEKPIALTLADTGRLIDLAAAHGVPLQVGFQRRFDAGLRAVRDRVASGDLGTLYSLRLLSHDHQPAGAAFIAGSGGIFRDLHVHDLDLAAWLTGSPVATVYATLAVREHRQYDVRHPTASGPVPDGDVSLVHLTTTSGVQVSIHGARHDPRGHDVRVELFGSRDSVTAGLTERTPLLPLDGDGVLDGVLDGGGVPGAAVAGTGPQPYGGFVDRFRDAFRAETAAFLDLIAGAANPCPPQTALAGLQAAIACEVSLLRGAPAAVSEIDVAGH